MEQVEQIEAKVNNSKRRLQVKQEKQEKQEVPTTLDSYYINNKIAES